MDNCVKFVDILGLRYFNICTCTCTCIIQDAVPAVYEDPQEIQEGRGVGGGTRGTRHLHPGQVQQQDEAVRPAGDILILLNLLSLFYIFLPSLFKNLSATNSAQKQRERLLTKWTENDHEKVTVPV